MQNVTHYIAVYEVDRAYGGPEEGGWYFDTGELVYCEPIAEGTTPEDVQARREALKAEWFDPEARPVHSVLYHGGQYEVTTAKGVPVPFYPAEIPRYE